MTEWVDRCAERYVDNSRLVAVDGNLAVGKHAFATKLASYFDLQPVYDFDERLCFPTLGHKFIDLREFDSLLPPAARPYDRAALFMDPKIAPHAMLGGGVANYATKLQVEIYKQRYYHYFDAVAHLLNTGQGSVIVRPMHSDYVYYEALRRCGWITDESFEYYNKYFIDTFIEAPAPHLVVYLKAPVDYVMKRVKQRGIPWEVNGCNVTEQYLRAINAVYEEDYLPKIAKTGEVIELDAEKVEKFTNEDWEYLADDIGKLDLEVRPTTETRRFEDWIAITLHEDRFSAYRSRFSSVAFCDQVLTRTPRKKLEELFEQPLLEEKISQVVSRDTRFKYDPLYNPHIWPLKKVLAGPVPLHHVMRSARRFIFRDVVPRDYYIERHKELVAYRESATGYRAAAQHRYDTLLKHPWHKPNMNYEEFDFLEQLEATALYKAHAEGRLDNKEYAKQVQSSAEGRARVQELDKLINNKLQYETTAPLTFPGNYSEAGDPTWVAAGPNVVKTGLRRWVELKAKIARMRSAKTWKEALGPPPLPAPAAHAHH